MSYQAFSQKCPCNSLTLGYWYFWLKLKYEGFKFRVEENRIFQLEGTYKDHVVQLPGQFRADPKFRHVAKDIFFKYLLNMDRLGASTSSLGVLFQYLGCMFSRCDLLQNMSDLQEERKKERNLAQCHYSWSILIHFVGTLGFHT